MPITFQCQACQAKMTVADTLAGKRGKCSKCKEPAVVPATANGDSRRPAGVPSFEDRIAAPSRPAFHDLDIFGDDEPVHVVVRTASAGV